jgi:phage portal protein BeeE
LLDRIRNFFTKQSRTTGIITVNHGQAQWIDTRYDKLADEGYTKNVYVYRCVNAIAMACAGIPWLLYQKNRKLKEIEKHPLIDLLANPNLSMGRAKFIENVIAYLQLSGKSYIEHVGPNNDHQRNYTHCALIEWLL